MPEQGVEASLVFPEKALFDDNPTPILVFAADTLDILAVNEAALQKYGYGREEMLARKVRDLRPTEDAGAWLVAYAESRAQTTPGPVAFPGTWRHRRKDGTDFPVDIWRVRVTFGGRPAVLAMVHDVTERLQIETQLRHAQKMEAIGQLAGGVAHDFNNLLSIIRGSAELAQRAAAAGQPLGSVLEDVVAATARGAELTRKLLAVSRKQILRVRTVDLAAMIDDFAKLIARVGGEDVTVLIDRPSQPLLVRADPTLIEQVLLNLCANARHAMPAGGTLRIALARRSVDEPGAAEPPWRGGGEWAEISVRDDGVGMDEATRARIFEPFFTTRPDGTGLGLATAFGIVEQHGGAVHVESAPGKGSTFRVLLPTTSGAALPPTPPMGGHVLGGTETILIAEDEPAVRDVLTTTLTSLGYRVVAAEDGEEACAVFDAHEGQIALVILDVVMPRLGGPEALARLRARRPDLKAIFITGYAPEQACLAPHTVLNKPFGIEDLARTVRRVLEVESP